MLFELFDLGLCIAAADDVKQYVKKEIAEGQAIKEDKRRDAERDAMPKYDARELAMKENKERDAAASFFQEQDAPAVDMASSMANIC